MNTLTVSATHARNNFFELLNLVISGKSIVVRKDTKEVAELIPRKKNTDWQALLQASAASHGILKKMSMKDSPLRRPGAWRSLGTWDKDKTRKNK